MHCATCELNLGCCHSIIGSCSSSRSVGHSVNFSRLPPAPTSAPASGPGPKLSCHRLHLQSKISFSCKFLANDVWLGLRRVCACSCDCVCDCACDCVCMCRTHVCVYYNLCINLSCCLLGNYTDASVQLHLPLTPLSLSLPPPLSSILSYSLALSGFSDCN